MRHNPLLSAEKTEAEAIAEQQYTQQLNRIYQIFRDHGNFGPFVQLSGKRRSPYRYQFTAPGKTACFRTLDEAEQWARQRLGKAESLELPNKIYDAIAIDPPWPYKLRVKDATHRNRIPYEPMAIEKIQALPISELCPKGVLWLWTTNNHMPEACQLLRYWGFTLKTILTWEKTTNDGSRPRIGTGHWLRNCTEHCLLATRGKVSSFTHQKLLTNQPTILHAPRREHSRKPEEFYSLVNHLCPGKKLDMFSRCDRPGWDSWGDQINMFTENQG